MNELPTNTDQTVPSLLRTIEALVELQGVLRKALAAGTERERLLQGENARLRAERDEVRQSYCSLMEAYRGGDGRVTANKLGWGYLFEEDKPCQ